MFSKRQKQDLNDLMFWGGCVPSSEWVTGTGSRTRRRWTPPFAERLTIEQAVRLPGAVGKQARKLHRSRPRVRLVVCITDYRRASAYARKAAA